MSYHVYLARAKFQDTPIPEDEWLAAAASVPALRVLPQQNRNGKTHHQVALVSDTKKRLYLLPNGLIDAQDPTQPVVAALFELATLLGGAVYSEKLKKYHSVADWEERTRSFRAEQARRRKTYRDEQKKIRQSRALLWLVVLACSLIIGGMLGG